jgi:uncharacterized protein (TIGR02594 family)
MQPKWHAIATAELGTQEIAGAKNNPRIVEYQRATGLAARDDETPWCGSFVAWCLSKAKQPYNVMTAARARAWMEWGRELKRPTLGCVVVFRRAGGGHVGFYAGEASGDRILVLGGNQGNAVSIKPYPRAQLLGYRWPKAVSLPTDVKPLGQSRVVQGSTVAAGAGMVSVIAEVADSLGNADYYLSGGTWLGIAAAVIVVAGAGYAIWSRIQMARA